MISISSIAAQTHICKVLALAFPRFYKRTGISPQFTFSYNEKEQGMEILIGFTPQEASKEQYSILFEELFDAEKLILNEYVINNSSNFENVNQLIFKHKEEMQQIIAKHKKGL